VSKATAAANSEFKVRAARLREIRAELQQALNYTDEQVVGPVKERIALAAALRLQHEIEMARMLQGLPVATDALVRLSESIASILPKPATPPLEIRFVDGDPSKGGRNEEMRLNERIKELEGKLREALRTQVPSPSPANDRTCGNQVSNVVVPFRSEGTPDWSALGLANIPIDRTGVLFNAADPSGKLQGKV
jgi:hypothetical protein